MRRRGFIWQDNTYIPANINTKSNVDKILEEIEVNIPIRAERIIRKFNEYGSEADPKTIAEEMDFDNHIEMAEYMEEEGLVWSLDDNNYIQGFEDKDVQDGIDDDASNLEIPDIKIDIGDVPEDELGELLSYLPLLRILGENREKLLDLLIINSPGSIVKYAVPGKPSTKSVYMSEILSRLMTEFCTTKNMSQREVVEGAIIDYLKRYGYKREVEKLLARK